MIVRHYGLNRYLLGKRPPREGGLPLPEQVARKAKDTGKDSETKHYLKILFSTVTPDPTPLILSSKALHA